MIGYTENIPEKFSIKNSVGLSLPQYETFVTDFLFQ